MVCFSVRRPGHMLDSTIQWPYLEQERDYSFLGTRIFCHLGVRCGDLSLKNWRQVVTLALHYPFPVIVIKIKRSMCQNLENSLKSPLTVITYTGIKLHDVLIIIIGGCMRPCDFRLECGHLCPFKVFHCMFFYIP